MSYQVLARKWRPRNFEEIVGQEHVLRALIHALDNDRLHHAFLFTGTRGVGKTTIARILAKSLNCEQGVSSRPCGECATCQEIDQGRFVDLIEVDAASRTKVDETRELLDNVQYAPTRGRYKVYLIDEVHMFSNHSFNALLKTLEEPPPHVKFLLATTDPQKLPVTILSRCLQFNLRRLSTGLLEGHLANVLQKEGIEADSTAMHRIARAADGSVRDALSLTDQAIAYGGGKVSEADVIAMLGSIEQDHVFRLLDALAEGNGEALLQVVGNLAQQAPDFTDVLAELVTTLHYLALLQQVPSAWDESMGEQARLTELAGRFTPEDLQLYYQIGLLGRRDLPLAPEPRTGLEMILLRMLAFRPVSDAAPIPSSRPAAATKTAASPVSPVTPAASPAASGSAVATVPTATAHASTPVSAVAQGAPAVATEWHQIAESLGLAGAIKQVVAHCVLEEHKDGVIKLALASAGAPFLTKEREATLCEALCKYFGETVRLHIEIKEADGESPAERQARLSSERLSQARAAIENDPAVQSIVEAFDGQVKADSVTPVD